MPMYLYWYSRMAEEFGVDWQDTLDITSYVDPLPTIKHWLGW